MEMTAKKSCTCSECGLFKHMLFLYMQPKMFSSCDALSYHWNPTSMAERVGLPPCNGSPTLNILTHRFSVPPVSPVSKSCGDGGVAKRQVEMRLTDHPSRGRFTKNQQNKLLVGAWNVRTLLDSQHCKARKKNSIDCKGACPLQDWYSSSQRNKVCWWGCTEGRWLWLHLLLAW